MAARSRASSRGTPSGALCAVAPDKSNVNRKKVRVLIRASRSPRAARQRSIVLTGQRMPGDLLHRFGLTVQDFGFQIGPELGEQSAGAAVSQRNSGAAHGELETAVQRRVIDIGDATRGESAEHIRKIERPTPATGAANEFLKECVFKASAKAALPQTKEAWVLV